MLLRVYRNVMFCNYPSISSTFKHNVCLHKSIPLFTFSSRDSVSPHGLKEQLSSEVAERDSLSSRVCSVVHLFLLLWATYFRFYGCFYSFRKFLISSPTRTRFAPPRGLPRSFLFSSIVQRYFLLLIGSLR